MKLKILECANYALSASLWISTFVACSTSDFIAMHILIFPILYLYCVSQFVIDWSKLISMKHVVGMIPIAGSST
jgi:hypothetical protein